MPKFPAASGALLLVLLAGTALSAAPVLAQTDQTAPADGAAPAEGEQANQVSNNDLLADFIHYVLIEQVEAARSMGQGLLDRQIDPAEFVKLVDSTAGVRRFQDAVVRAGRHSSLEPVSAALFRLYEDGKRTTVRSPASIAENIKLLTGDARARALGADRLRAAREYAMPQLLQALLQRQDGRLRAEVRQLMVEMGRDAVMPLAAALIDMDPASQEMVADILGDIGYPTAVPFLYQLRAHTSVAQVREASEDAIRRIVGAINDSVPVSQRFVDLADTYYRETPSVTVFTGESHQIVWDYDPGVGLIAQGIETPVYHEAMAMRLTETALREDPTNADAVPLWLAANFSREIDTPKDEGYVNPLYPDTRRDAMYYAVMSGAAPTERVLARGLDDNDTPLVRLALAALEQTAGGSSLWTGADSAGARRPLLDALRYPSRRVQYEAALALGAAGPQEPFNGSDQVVRILGSAIRDAATKYALVISAGDGAAERAATLGEVLRSQGYTVLPPATSLNDAAQSISDVPGIDLIVAQLPSASTADLIEQAHNNARLRATPILGIVSVQGYAEQANRYLRDPRVQFIREGANGQEIGTAAQALVERATGGDISPEEAEAYKTRALAVLRDLAVSGNQVLNAADASGPLVAALGPATGPVKMQIAEVLAFLPTRSAQQAVMDAAAAAEGEERVALLGKLAGSAKRFGNQLEARHIVALKEMATGGADAEATAAAAAMGSLNLPSGEIVPMILGTEAMAKQ